jgi:hypothetical protein
MSGFRRIRIATGVVVCLSALALGCSDDGDAEGTGSADGSTGAARPVDGTGGEADVSDGEVIDVVLDDYEFRGLPESVEVGTRVRIRNESSDQPHEFIALRLPEGEERPLEELLGLPQQELTALIGAAEPEVVLVAPPGRSRVLGVGDDTFSQAGRYMVLCSVPVGSSPEDYLSGDRYVTGRLPEASGGGEPHFTRGMLADLRVS